MARKRPVVEGAEYIDLLADTFVKMVEEKTPYKFMDNLTRHRVDNIYSTLYKLLQVKEEIYYKLDSQSSTRRAAAKK